MLKKYIDCKKTCNSQGTFNSSIARFSQQFCWIGVSYLVHCSLYFKIWVAQNKVDGFYNEWLFKEMKIIKQDDLIEPAHH